MMDEVVALTKVDGVIDEDGVMASGS